MNQYSLATGKHRFKNATPSTLTSNCDSILKYGRYIDDVNQSPSGWQPDGCAMKTYRSMKADSLTSCFKPGDQVIFMGDSTTRQVYWGFTNILQRGTLQKMDDHSDSQVVINGVIITLAWSSYFNETNVNNIRAIAEKGLKAPQKRLSHKYNKDKNYVPKTYLYMTAGSWFAGREDPKIVAKSYTNKTSSILKDLDNRVDDAFEAVYFAPPLIPYYESLDRNRQISMTHAQIHSIEHAADVFFNYVRTNETVKSRVKPAMYSGGVRYRTRKGRTDKVSAYYVPVFNELSAENHQGAHDDMGIHYWERGFLIQANILLNHICNNRIAKETGRPPSGATCCVEYDDYTYQSQHSIFIPSIGRIFDKAILIAPLFLLILYAYNYETIMVKPVFKASVRVILVIGLITGWARISNETQLISKTSVHYSPAEMSGLLQLWAAFSIISIFSLTRYFSYGVENKPTKGQQSRLRLSRPLLLELQGICVSLLLIVQYTGYNLVAHVFDGELLTRVLISTWALVELYIFCLEYFDSFSSIQIEGQVPLANASIIEAYILPFPVFAKSISRVAILPMLLSVSVSYSVHDSLPGTIAQSYIDPACKLAFWYTLVYFGYPWINIASEASLAASQNSLTKDDPNDLETYLSPSSIPNIQLGIETSMLILGFSIPQIFFPAFVSYLNINPANSFLRIFISICDDYWIMLFAVWVALFSSTQMYNLDMDVANFACPTGILAAVAGFTLLGFFDIGKYAFDYYLPVSEAGVTHPISFIDRHEEPYELLLDARGRYYTSITHSAFVVGGVTAYFILRLSILRHTRKNLQDHSPAVLAAPAAQYFYIDGWVRMAKFSYEILELYPYIFLALSGTVRLHYFPTGVVYSSLLTRTYAFVDRDFVFPYFQWRVVEKFRKCASIALSLAVLLILAHAAASVWNNQVMGLGSTEMVENEPGSGSEETGTILALNVAEDLANGSVVFDQDEAAPVSQEEDEKGGDEDSRL